MTAKFSELIVYIAPITGLLTLFFVRRDRYRDQHIKSKDSEIQSLRTQLEAEKRRNEGLNNELTSMSEGTDNAYAILEEILSNISEKKLVAGDILALRRIMANLQKLESSQKTLNDYKIAASKLNESKAFLVRKTSAKMLKDFKDYIPEFQVSFPWKRNHIRKEFEKDLECYLNWVYDCLYVSGHPHNNPLTKFVSRPSVSSVTPYVEAIRHIKSVEEWNSLNLEQSASLERMLEELIERLHEEFKSE